MMVWNDVGKRVGTLRRDRKWTRAKFGEMIGVTAQYVGKIERGDQKITVDLIAVICKTTGASADFIIFGISNILDISTVMNEFSHGQIEAGFDILMKLAQMINSDNGNEALLQAILRRQKAG
jgi:transcriptional regulator with XRE-family HTH domain